MGQMKAEEAVLFFEEKGRKFGNEFAALFSKYNIKSPVNGNSIASAIREKGNAFAHEVSEILNFKSYDGEGYDPFGDKLKGFASKVGNVYKGYKEKQDAKKSFDHTDMNDSTAEFQKGEDKKKGKKAIWIGIGAFVFLVIIIVIISKAKGKGGE